MKTCTRQQEKLDVSKPCFCMLSDCTAHDCRTPIVTVAICTLRDAVAVPGSMPAYLTGSLACTYLPTVLMYFVPLPQKAGVLSHTAIAKASCCFALKISG